MNRKNGSKSHTSFVIPLCGFILLLGFVHTGFSQRHNIQSEENIRQTFNVQLKRMAKGTGAPFGRSNDKDLTNATSPCKSFYDYVCTGEKINYNLSRSNVNSKKSTSKTKQGSQQKTYFDILQKDSYNKTLATIKDMWQYHACIKHREAAIKATKGGSDSLGTKPMSVYDKPYKYDSKSNDQAIDVAYALATLTGHHLVKGGKFFLGVDVIKKVDKDSYCFDIYSNEDDEAIMYALKNAKEYEDSFILDMLAKMKEMEARKSPKYEDKDGDWDVRTYVSEYARHDIYENTHLVDAFINRVLQVVYDGEITDLGCIHYNGQREFYKFVVEEAVKHPQSFVNVLNILIGNATYASRPNCAQEVMYHAKEDFNLMFLSMSSYAESVSSNVKSIIEDLRDAMKMIVRESKTIVNKQFKQFALEKLNKVKIYVLTDVPEEQKMMTVMKRMQGYAYKDWKAVVEFKAVMDVVRKKDFVHTGLNPSEFRRFNGKLSYSSVYRKTTIGIVNAWYDPLENTITVPAGIVGWPIYQGNSYGTTDMYDLSRLGMILAHELGHSLDNHGQCFDWRGNYDPTFCKDHTKEVEIKERSQVRKRSKMGEAMDCLARDYGHPCGKDDNYGRKTLGEDIADQLGARAAYIVFNKKYAPYIRLEDQRDFWRKYASLWCNGAHPSLTTVSKDDGAFFLNTKSKSDIEKDKKKECAIVSRDVHALPKHRVDKTLRQLEEFSVVFQCKQEDDMVHETPCLIY